MKTLDRIEPATESGGGIKNSDGIAIVVRQHSKSLKFFKRSIDVLVSLAFFACFSWLYLILWIGVVASSGRPAIYSQLRYGKDGKLFKFYKFRSMVSDADKVLEKYLESNSAARQQWNEFQKLEHDPRITKFGRFIRKSSLDEFPQFWNVLIGDMSVVGPRPCMLGQKELYGSQWGHYCAVRPGITGLWQVSGRNKLNYRSRVALDVEYVQRMSFWFDAWIAFKTISVMITGHGSR
jgi:lipopolysaccharide/colanic/teichoic acid biosynthesis glycosyltransferase